MRTSPVTWTAEELSLGYIADYKPYNFVDGEGVRCSLYVSGCPFACAGCYNEVAQDFSYGRPYTKELEDQIIEDLKANYCQGLTLLGGEPFLNTQVTLSLCERVRAEFGEAKDIWAWTGYTYQELLKSNQDKMELLELIDVLVDGRFVEAKKDLNLAFRGSSNQKIIDVKKTLASDKIILWNNGDYT